MTTYSDKLRDPRWQKKRLEIMQRDNFACHECGITTVTLHVHHTRYIKGTEPWDHPSALLLTLCENCHNDLHGGGVTGPECLQSSVLRRGGTAAVFWSLAVYLDSVQPGAAKFTPDQWTAAARAFANTLEEFARGDE